MFQLTLLLTLLIIGGECDERGARVRRIVGGSPAALPPEDAPVVFTRFAGKSARVVGTRDFPHYVFKGIRFAHPPTGKYRFLRPRQYFLDGHENATRYPPPCPQPSGRDIVVGEEDCLFLNVFTPDLPTGMEGLPVVVWIHGGGFRYGSASQYGVRHLVGKQVVVVTIQYRLGSLGFLSTGSKELPGNAALWDMVLATQWVRNYIGFFGGNPHKIVVMGHGTGASSAMLMSLSNVAKGLSSGIVAMSGSSLSSWAIDDTPSDTAKEIAEQNGCPINSPLTMVRCLQNLSPASVIKGDSMIEFQKLQTGGFVSGLTGRLGSAPVSEGVHDGRSQPNLIEYNPYERLTNNLAKIPVLTGVTKDETKRAVAGQNVPKDILKNILKPFDKIAHKFMAFESSFSKIPIIQPGGEILDVLERGRRNVLGFDQITNLLQAKYAFSNLTEGLGKVSEATGDALFNAPAFLTAEVWSRKGLPAFMYRFDHCGKKKKGSFFLKGLPLVGNTTIDDNDTVSHGDELAYLFDPQDLEGRKMDLNENADADDNKVRDIFTQMIADFARFGKVSVGKESLRPFSATDNNFVQIAPIPKFAKEFRFCEMALWLNLADRLKSSSCQYLQLLQARWKDAQEFMGLSEWTSGGNLGQVLNPDLLGRNGGSNKKNEMPLNKPLDFLGGNQKNGSPVAKPLDFLGGKSRNPLSGIIG